MEPSLKYVESCTYHVAGHIVVAAVQELPLHPGGVRIDKSGNGLALYAGRLPDGSRNVGSEIERERTIISLNAGFRALYVSQGPWLKSPFGDARDDIKIIHALLNEMYSDENKRKGAKQRLWNQTQILVKSHWAAIQAVAKALWAKPWTARTPEPKNDWSQLPEEKFLSGFELQTILSEFQIGVSVENSASQAPREISSPPS